MQAVILAAGMGSRLKELTQNNTKCMVKVDGVTLIERALRQLEQIGLSRIIIVVGYEGEKLTGYVDGLRIKTPVIYINNAVYDKTNNIYSLALAKDYLMEEDTLLLESDLIFEDELLRVLMDDSRDTLALVDKYERWMDGTVVKLDADDNIIEFVPGKRFRFEEKDEYYKTVNIYKFSKQFSVTHYVPFLEAYMKALGHNEYYEQVLGVISGLEEPVIRAKRLNGQKWYEIDDVQDLDIATTLFAHDKEKQTELVKERQGGYWRYPKLLDFSCPVNPFFPPKKLLDEMKASFEVLVTQQPSGMKVNELLAAKYFGVNKEHIIPGNSTAELIRAVFAERKGKTGYVSLPTEEYAIILKEESAVPYMPQHADTAYTSGEIIAYFEEQEIADLVIQNPDCLTGNYLNRAEQEQLLEWTREKNIRLIWDESFADFADEEANSFMKEEILSQYPGLIVLKNLSKACGIPGLRLGVLASSDEELLAEMKHDASIGNINSLAEFYLQIAEKYKKEYSAGMRSLRKEKAYLVKELEGMQFLRVRSSRANYIVAEITDGRTVKELTGNLLMEHNILVKERGEHLYIAVRNRRDNERLMEALRDCR